MQNDDGRCKIISQLLIIILAGCVLYSSSTNHTQYNISYFKRYIKIKKLFL